MGSKNPQQKVRCKGILSPPSFPCRAVAGHLDSGRQRVKPRGKPESGTRTESEAIPYLYYEMTGFLPKLEVIKNDLHAGQSLKIDRYYSVTKTSIGRTHEKRLKSIRCTRNDQPVKDWKLKIAMVNHNQSEFNTISYRGFPRTLRRTPTTQEDAQWKSWPHR